MNNIALLTIIIALVYAAIGLSTPLVTLYLQSLGADYSRIAIILATTAAVALVSSYFWGRASDALGRRKPLIVGGLAGVAVAYFLLSQVTGFDGAWAVRLGEAAAMAAYSTTSLALMGDLLSTSGARGKRMGTYRGIGSLAFAGGALIGGRLADAYSMRLTFGFAAVFYLVAALIALLLREPRLVQANATSRRPAADRLPPPSSVFRLGLGLPWLFLARRLPLADDLERAGLDVAQLHGLAGLCQDRDQQPVGAGRADRGAVDAGWRASSPMWSAAPRC